MEAASDGQIYRAWLTWSHWVVISSMGSLGSVSARARAALTLSAGTKSSFTCAHTNKKKNEKNKKKKKKKRKKKKKE